MNEENHVIYKPLKPVMEALRNELASRNIPVGAFHLQPILFSGNFSGDQKVRNAPAYGFTVTLRDEAYRSAVEACFSELKHYPRVHTLQNEKGNPALSGESGKEFAIGYTARDLKTLTQSLNARVFSNTNQLPESSLAL